MHSQLWPLYILATAFALYTACRIIVKDDHD